MHRFLLATTGFLLYLAIHVLFPFPYWFEISTITNCVSAITFNYFLDYLDICIRPPVTVTGWQDFAESLTDSVPGRRLFLLLRTVSKDTLDLYKTHT